GGGRGGAQPHEGAARRLQVAYAGGEGGEFVQRVAELVEGQRLHVELDVGALARRVRAREQPELRRRHGQWTAAEQRVVEHHAPAADERAIGLVERLGPRHLIDEPKLQMILQVLADAGLAEHQGNAQARNPTGSADAGELEDLHRADRAGGEDHLAARVRGSARAVLPPAHPRRARAVELDLFDQAVHLEAQIRALERRLEKGARRRPASPAFLVDVEDATAFVVAGVEIGDALDARLLRRRAERIED